jgi:hypothetical protein
MPSNDAAAHAANAVSLNISLVSSPGADAVQATPEAAAVTADNATAELETLPWELAVTRPRPAFADDFARKLHDCRPVKLGSGVHFLQEDHPGAIGRSVASFIAEIEGRSAKNHSARAPSKDMVRS